MNLSDLLQSGYLAADALEAILATGGSTTTVVNSAFNDKYGDDDLLDGAAFVIRDSAGASAAPEGEFQRISAYAQDTYTVTVDTAFSAAVAAGDTIGIARAIYPIRTAIELANNALRSLGTITLVDTTTLTTASVQTEYANSVTWKYNSPIRIDLQTNDDSNDNRWMRIADYEVIPAAAGSTGLIVFGTQLSADYKLRIWYETTHPRLSVWSDKVHEDIHPELARAAVVEEFLRWQNTRQGGQDDFLKERWNEAKDRLDRAKVDFRIRKKVYKQPVPYSLGNNDLPIGVGSV